jgi:hypothetical protein
MPLCPQCYTKLTGKPPPGAGGEEQLSTFQWLDKELRRYLPQLGQLGAISAIGCCTLMLLMCCTCAFFLPPGCINGGEVRQPQPPQDAPAEPGVISTARLPE